MAEALRGLGPVVLTRYASPRSEDPRALLPLFPGAKVVEDPRGPGGGLLPGGPGGGGGKPLPGGGGSPPP